MKKGETSLGALLSGPSVTEAVMEGKLRDKVLQLDNVDRASRLGAVRAQQLKAVRSEEGRRRLGRRARRLLGIDGLGPPGKRRRRRSRSSSQSGDGATTTTTAAAVLDEEMPPVTYSLFEAVHQLWRQYMAEFLEETRRSGRAAVEARLIKADFHGAKLTVVQSKAASLVGTTGIVVKETENVFHLVTKADRMARVPKAGAVFTLLLGEDEAAGVEEETEGGRRRRVSLVTLYGNHIRQRSGDRVTRKYKLRTTLEL